MTAHQITISLKLDRAYDRGFIAFVSANNLLVPIRERGDIRPTETGEIAIHFGNDWLPVRPELIKFCHRH